MRRLPGRCYFCGDPTVGDWYCAAHLWAGEGLERAGEITNAIEHVTREHAFWIERFTPTQIVELASYLEPNATGVAA